MFGEALKATRERLGESQTKFAERLFVDQTTLSRWETTERSPRGATLKWAEQVLAELNSQAVLNSEAAE
jgi:transcriptional regulator with XRE-family HTH domain